MQLEWGFHNIWCLEGIANTMPHGMHCLLRNGLQLSTNLMSQYQSVRSPFTEFNKFFFYKEKCNVILWRQTFHKKTIKFTICSWLDTGLKRHSVQHHRIVMCTKYKPKHYLERHRLLKACCFQWNSFNNVHSKITSPAGVNFLAYQHA